MQLSVVRRTRRVVPLLAVLPLALGTPAHAANVGAGVVTGSVAFTNPGGLPPAGGGCVNPVFQLNGIAHAFVLNTAITGYAGPVNLSGSGSGTCENATLGMGTVTLAASGYVDTTQSRIECPTLTGTYLRAATKLTTILFGNCSVNNFPLTRVTFVAEVNFVPDNLDAGPEDPIHSATFYGGFTVSPS